MADESNVPFAAIARIVDYLYADEERNFHEARPKAKGDHIFNDVRVVRDWLTQNQPRSGARQSR
jgi:hypothetical protein